jgi:hypothetical protein
MSTLRVEALEQPDGTAFVFNNKNLLINGGMNVWQRSTSASVSTSIYSTVDRFATRVNSLGVFTISRSTDVPSAQGFGYSTKWDCTTADASPAANDFLMMQQIIEGQNLQHLMKGTSSAKSITLSFWVKSNKTGTYIASLYDGDNTRRISKSYTIDSASTWEKKTITFDGDTTGVFDNDNGASLWVQWWLGAGSNFTSGTLATSWESNTDANAAVGVVNLADSTSNEWYMTGCQLEVGSTASGFEFEPVDKIEQKCFRYYYSTRQINASTYPGASFAHGISSTRYASGTTFPVTMRAFPSVTIRRPSDNVAGDAHKYLGVDGSTTTGDVNLGTVVVVDRGRTGFPYFTVTAGGNTGGGLLFHYEASAEL